MAKPPAFSNETIAALRERVRFLCSRPDCRASTVGPKEGKASGVARTGEAAHIRGAKPGSARFESGMSDEERANISNGIWLCVRCHRLVDADDQGFSVVELESWKNDAENVARKAQRNPGGIENEPQIPAILWSHGTTDDDTYVPREKVIEKLGHYIIDYGIRTVTLHGIGGTGKTSLIGHWLKSGQATNSDRFTSVLFWSFYSDRDVDALLRRILEVIDPSYDQSPRSSRKPSKRRSRSSRLTVDEIPIERFERTARLAQPLLIVLDGVEVLQHGLLEGIQYGRFVDVRLQVLLDEIARLKKPWLVICTSRFPLTDRIQLQSDRHYELGALEPQEALDLLTHNGVRGAMKECSSIVVAFQGHPLALRLFAASLPRNLRHMPEIHLSSLLGSLPDDAPFREKVNRLVTFYSDSLEPIQRLILQTLSIFQSPVPISTIENLVSALAESTGQFDEPIRHVKYKLTQLRSSGIVIYDDTLAPAYSCHPVVLDSFRRELLGRSTGQAAIALLTGRPDEIGLQGVSEFEPLILALNALNIAGDTQNALRIYSQRFDNGRVFVRKGLAFEAVRVFNSFLFASMNNRAPAGTAQSALQFKAERKFLIPAADFDISLGELRSADQRLDRATEVSDRSALSDIYKNRARIRYHRGDLLGSVEEARKSCSHSETIATTAISTYYELRALSCAGEHREARDALSRLKELRPWFDAPDLKILEPMSKIFLGMRSGVATKDTSAIQQLKQLATDVLSVPLQLEAKILELHSRCVWMNTYLIDKHNVLEREIAAGSYSIRRCQLAILDSYASWRNGSKANITALKRAVEVAEDANFFIVQCEGVWVLSLCADTDEEQQRYAALHRTLVNASSYTTTEYAFPEN